MEIVISDYSLDVVGLINTYSRIKTAKGSNMIAIWKLPEGVSANKDEMLVTRMKHYRFVMKHYLRDGTQIIPSIVAMKHIFDAFDMFELPVAISPNTYTIDDRQGS